MLVQHRLIEVVPFDLIHYFPKGRERVLYILACGLRKPLGSLTVRRWEFSVCQPTVPPITGELCPLLRVLYKRLDHGPKCTVGNRNGDAPECKSIVPLGFRRVRNPAKVEKDIFKQGLSKLREEGRRRCI